MTMIQVGAQAPDFELTNQFGVPVRLSSFRAEKAVALVFFPLAFSGICTGELAELRDNLARFEVAGVEVLGVSVDSKFSLRAWADKEDYQFSLLADFWPHGEVAATYGVFLDEPGLANRATFLIDTSGVVQASFVTAPGEPRPFDQYIQGLTKLQTAI